mgnify:FL=1
MNPDAKTGLWDAQGHIESTYCLPKRIPSFNYTGLIGYHEDGTRATPDDVAEFRVDGAPLVDFESRIFKFSPILQLMQCTIFGLRCRE